ncbi:MAG TPA: alpha/beta fold hydrolase [Gammaproteobacteria bacterium]|nr:alpha/beta fold hydrolase [Gammaproteobacteria bacterium]
MLRPFTGHGKVESAMFRQWFLSVIFLTIFSLQAAYADVLVLVHGYASDAATWEASGVNYELQANGWSRAGVLVPGLAVPSPVVQGSPNKSFAVELPAAAPLLVQADVLRHALDVVRQRYPDERLVLVGHSAGGVVARLVLLGGNPYRVDELITIASPHLGTVRAAQGLDIVDSKPFFCPGPGIDFLKHVVGGSDYDYLEYSRGVLIDLLPAESGNILAWMNQQPHPDIRYVSIVREAPFALGDDIVPAYSQDMNNVPALRGRSQVLYTPAGHSLNPQDGALLARILKGDSI